MKQWNVTLTDGSDWIVIAATAKSAINKAKKTLQFPGCGKGVVRVGWYFGKVSRNTALLSGK